MPVLLGLAVLLGLLATACSQGSYPLDIFQEMHYSQAVRIQEPPSLSPPEGAVPITGVEAPLIELIVMENPVPPVTTNGDDVNDVVLERGAHLFAVNCSMCHGLEGDGDSFIARRIKIINEQSETTVIPPASFVDPPAFESNPDLPDTYVSSFVLPGNDGAAFFLLATGRDVMPSFKKLLTEEDRWTLIRYIQFLWEQ